jgi:hypothetical protein
VPCSICICIHFCAERDACARAQAARTSEGDEESCALPPRPATPPRWRVHHNAAAFESCDDDDADDEGDDDRDRYR